MNDMLLLLAVADTIWSRLGVCAVACVVGVIFIITGIANIQNKTAEESGRRRSVNKLLGNSNTYEPAFPR